MTIYEPAEDSYLLQKHIVQYAQGRVLDIGTGSGIQALTAIKNPQVREIIAVDTNPEAVLALNKKIEEEYLRKIKVLKGSLFEPVEGKFNLIIFNPPYLPQDKGIVDQALYGGKHGWELSERFFREVTEYLFPDGIILFLFSSLTNKEKIDSIIQHQLLQAEEIDRQKLSFEELYIYAIRKSTVLLDLERQGISGITYFTHGKRGNIFLGTLDKNKLVKTHFSSKEYKIPVAIKVKRQESEAQGRIANEAHWLEILNTKSIGPQLLFSGTDFLVYEFVEGPFFGDWMLLHSRDHILKALDDILQQCFVLDQLQVNKEEMHHQQKHIVMNNLQQPVLLDFERCEETDKPKNVTQFVEYICRMKDDLGQKNIVVDPERLRELAQQYKHERTQENLDQVKVELKHKAVLKKK